MKMFRSLLVVALTWLSFSGYLGATEKITYVYTDLQGTTLASTDAQGNIASTFDYRPFGAQSLGAPPDGPGYTGHVNDPDSGFVYMQARYYDPLGRMLSVDPIVPAPGNVFSFNRYSYANNSPIVNIDPDGRETGCVTQSSHCIGRNPAAEAASRTLIQATIGVGKAAENGALELSASLQSGKQETAPYEPSNDTQAAGMLLGTIVVEAAKSEFTDGGATEAGAASLERRLTYLYQKLDASGGHLKFGITYNPAGRYSKASLAGGRLNILASGSRQEMLGLERDLHETLPIGSEERQSFYIQKQVDKGFLPPPYKP